jgi:Tol biopolymer transport system component
MMRAFLGVLVAVIVAVAAAPVNGTPLPTVPGVAYVTGGQTGAFHVWVADTTGGNARELGIGDQPVVSPNGRMVVDSSDSNGYAITVYRTSTGAARSYFSLKKVTSFSMPLAWSSDSRYVAVALSPNDLETAALAIIDTRTGRAKVIEKGTVVHGASFAPAGSDQLAYAGDTRSLSLGSPTNIFTVTPNGTTRRQLTTDGQSLNPVWGRLGIAFDRERTPATGYSPLYQIWFMRSNGSHREQITHTHVGLPHLIHGLVPLALSADGSRLAAELEGQDTSRGYAVSILTRRSTQLEASGHSVTAWGISRDGRSILVDVGLLFGAPDQSSIEQIPFFGGAGTPLIAQGDDPSWNR